MWKRFVEWLKGTGSTLLELKWETRFWVAVGLAGIFYPPLAGSISVVFFMSAWANAKASAIQKKEVEKEIKEEVHDEVDQELDEREQE